MTNTENYLKNLTGKDEDKAAQAASYLLDSADFDLFVALVNKADYLFDFVLDNVYKRIRNAVNSDNYKNVIKFFDCYSCYFDDLFAEILANNADEDLTDEIFDILENGNDSQKTYAAKYFAYIPDTVALEILTKYAFSDNEYLSSNVAQALGQMQDDITYDEALGYLSSGDDFDKLKALKFLNAYGRKFPLKEALKAMRESKIPENMAGQIAYSVNLNKFLNSEYRYDILLSLLYIISGLGEILPVSDIVRIDLFDLLDILIHSKENESQNSKIISLIVLSAYSKFKTFTENGEYLYDEDKNTKSETVAIFNLLKSQSKDYYDKQKLLLTEAMNDSCEYISLLIQEAVELNLKESSDKLKSLLDSDNEAVVCEAAGALNKFKMIDASGIDLIASKIKNENIKAVILSYKSQTEL